MFVFVDILSNVFIPMSCILQDEVGVVFMATEARHGFEDGTYVTFHGAQGMTEVNGQEFRIAVPSKYR